MRAFWTGYIAVGHVRIPVGLYVATKDRAASIHKLHTKCKRRISMIPRCEACGYDLPQAHIGKGHEVAPGRYALFTPEELKEMDGPSNGTIQVVQVINPADVNLSLVEKTYLVGPHDKTAEDFRTLRSVLEDMGRVAVVRLQLRTRRSLALLRPQMAVFAVDMLRPPQELINPNELYPNRPRVRDEVKRQAGALLESMVGTFDPDKKPEEYEVAK